MASTPLLRSLYKELHMKLIKYSALLVAAALLSACGGHDFEGVYESRAGSSNDVLNAFAEMAGADRIVIGDDYIESEGRRTTFDDIFERESAVSPASGSLAFFFRLALVCCLLFWFGC